jgi:hypothetical protein
MYLISTSPLSPEIGLSAFILFLYKIRSNLRRVLVREGEVITCLFSGLYEIEGFSDAGIWCAKLRRLAADGSQQRMRGVSAQMSMAGRGWFLLTQSTCGHRAQQKPVLHFESTVEDIQRPVIMCDNNHTGVAFVGCSTEQFHHLPATMAVECGSWFVRQYQARLVGQYASHRYALLLAAGEGVRQIVRTVRHAEVTKQFQRMAS